MWPYTVPGIPDDMFERVEKIPMTKEEIRALALSKARIRRGSRFLDIGSGTGSVTVEAALLVGPEGVVYAVDKDPEAVELTKRNARRFGVDNRVTVIHGEAPEALENIRDIDTAFVGGGSERIEEILGTLYRILRSNGRIVIDAILIETASRAIASLEKLGFRDIEVTEVIIAKGLHTRLGTAMIARNPVFILSANKP